MGNAFGMIPGLEPDEWSNDACRGYVIMAMENCGFSKKDRSVWNKRAACIGTMQIERGLGTAQQAF